MFMILGTSFKEKLPVDAFSDNFVKVHQSQNWSCKLELGAGVPNCNIDRSPQSSAETSQKCGQPLELILDERKNDNGWIMFELKGDGFYKRCFKLQTAPPTLHSSSFLGRVWRWHHHTLVSRVTCHVLMSRTCDVSLCLQNVRATRERTLVTQTSYQKWVTWCGKFVIRNKDSCWIRL